MLPVTISRDKKCIIWSCALLLTFISIGIVICALVFDTYNQKQNRNFDTVCGYGELDNSTASCICFETYAKYNSNLCNYKLKSYNMALVTNIFFGLLGVEYLYLEFYTGFAIMLASFAIGISTLFYILTLKGPDNLIKLVAVYLLTIIFLGSSISLWVINMFLFGFNVYKDANGFTLSDFT